jgi:hypothetical protein
VNRMQTENYIHDLELRNAARRVHVRPLGVGDLLVNAEYHRRESFGTTLVAVITVLVVAALFVFGSLGLIHPQMQVIATYLGVR